MDLLTIRDVCAILKVNRHTLRRWCERGWLRSIDLTPDEARPMWRFRREDVDSFIETRRTKPS